MAKNRGQFRVTANPCQDCLRPIPQCPWLFYGKPVPGWEAETRRYAVGHNGDRGDIMAETYAIKSCPLYIPAGDRYSNPAELTEAQSDFFLRRRKK